MARLAGKDASMVLDGAEVKGVSEWTLDDEAPEIDVSGFDSGDHGDYLNARAKATVSISGHWETTETKMYGAPPAISSGQTGTAKLYIDVAKFYQMAVRVNKVTTKVNVDESVDWSAELRVTGDITYPA